MDVQYVLLGIQNVIIAALINGVKKMELQNKKTFLKKTNHYMF